MNGRTNLSSTRRSILTWLGRANNLAMFVCHPVYQSVSQPYNKKVFFFVVSLVLVYFLFFNNGIKINILPCLLRLFLLLL